MNRASVELDHGNRALVAARIFGALADPQRLRLLRTIARSPHGEICIADLDDVTGSALPALTSHLSELVAAGLVRAESRRDGWVWFTMIDSAADIVDEVLDDVFRTDEVTGIAS
ncbi:MAG: helix-turn-helix domain-containing protein [Acidimicrobiales bacterium]